MPKYGQAEYWNERYTNQQNDTFDWLESWKDIKSIVESHAITDFNTGDENQQTSIKQYWFAEKNYFANLDAQDLCR